MKVALKELRETFNALRIVQTAKWLSTGKPDQVLNETISSFQYLSEVLKPIQEMIRGTFDKEQREEQCNRKRER
jgi:hypothetical protein